MKKWRYSSLNNKKLEHTSFWLDPWTKNCIKSSALSGNVSQGLFINAVVLDYWLRKQPPEHMNNPRYTSCKAFVDSILHRIH